MIMEPRCRERGGETVVNLHQRPPHYAGDGKSEQNNPAAPRGDAIGDTWRDANSKLKGISSTNVSGFNVQNLIARRGFSSQFGVAEASFLKN